VVAARTGERVLTAVLAAESGLRAVSSSWPSGLEQVPLGTLSEPVSGAVGESGSYVVRIRRLARELYLLESRGEHVPSGIGQRSARTVWVLDPAARVGAQGAAVVSGGGFTATEIGVVTGADAHAFPPGWSAHTCAALNALIDSLFTSGSVVPLDVLPSDRAGAWDELGRLRPFDPVGDPGDPPGLGLIPLDSLVAVAAPLEGRLVPVPADCLSAARPGGDCGSVPGLRGGQGDFTVSTGSALGVLAVDGDLVLEGDATAAGWVLASGSVTVRGDARLDGFIRAGGEVRVAERGAVTASPCAGLLALSSAWLRRPRIVPGGALLGPLP
jgi:hypothetical protein